MAIALNTIKPNKGARKDAKRVGRGLSKGGTYSGHGVKGQSARSGVSGLRLKGLRPLMLSIKKSRGFKSHHEKFAVVNVGDLAKAFPDGAKISPESVLEAGLVGGISAGVKVLAGGKIGIKLVLSGFKVSEAAKQKIEQAGGSIV